MRWLFFVLICAGCGASPSPTARGIPAPPGPSRVDTLLAELITPTMGSGAAVTIDRETHVAGALFDGGPAVTGDTLFDVASVSKLLTAAKIVALAHQGRLSLDDAVRHWLPGVKLMFEGRDRAGEITLAQLLSHRAGVPHQPPDLDPARFGSSWEDPELLRKLTDDWTVPLVVAPGQYSYSNLGYALLGAIIERIEQTSFADAMQPFVVELGMARSTFWPIGIDDAAHGRIAQGHAVTFNAPDWYASRYALPFNGLWTSSRDLARFGEALIAASHDPAHPLHVMTAGTEGHGLGPVHRERLGALALEHDGGGPGFLAWLIVVPAQNRVLAIVCNADGETRSTAQHFREVVDAMISLR